MFSRSVSQPPLEGAYQELPAHPAAEEKSHDGLIVSATKGAFGYLGSAASNVGAGAVAVTAGAYGAVTTVGSTALSAVQAAGGAVHSAGSSVASAVSGAGSKALEATPRVLVVADKALDYVPFGSLASGVVDITLQKFVFEGIDPSSSQFKEYIEHIQKKDPKKCILYGIPFAGNVCALGVTVWDYFYQKPKEHVELAEPHVPPPFHEAEEDTLARLGLVHGASAEVSALVDTSAALGGGDLPAVLGAPLAEAGVSRESFAPSTPRRRAVAASDIVAQRSTSASRAFTSALANAPMNV